MHVDMLGRSSWLSKMPRPCTDIARLSGTYDSEQNSSNSPACVCCPGTLKLRSLFHVTAYAKNFNIKISICAELCRKSSLISGTCDLRSN